MINSAYQQLEFATSVLLLILKKGVTIHHSSKQIDLTKSP